MSDLQMKKNTNMLYMVLGAIVFFAVFTLLGIEVVAILRILAFALVLGYIITYVLPLMANNPPAVKTQK